MTNSGRKYELHGKKHTQEYVIWCGMVQQCCDKNASNYHLYGGRGIKVCLEWLDSFEAFLRDVGNRPDPNAQLDRIDNARGYHPANVKWVSPSENNRNRRLPLSSEVERREPVSATELLHPHYSVALVDDPVRSAAVDEILNRVRQRVNR